MAVASGSKCGKQDTTEVSRKAVGKDMWHRSVVQRISLRGLRPSTRVVTRPDLMSTSWCFQPTSRGAETVDGGEAEVAGLTVG
jgi:hypothetical protein